tara:strand:- start:2649 stop:3083 length:435 start_codon:yes stop_codon:yes gene_type:complete
MREKMLKEITEKALNSKDYDLVGDLISYPLNLLMQSVVVALENISEEKIKTEERMRIVATILSDIQRYIVPIRVSLGLTEEGYEIDGTKFAIDTRAIQKGMNIQLREKDVEGGRTIEVRIGIEIPEEISELVDGASISNTIGKA